MIFPVENPGKTGVQKQKGVYSFESVAYGTIAGLNIGNKNSHNAKLLS